MYMLISSISSPSMCKPTLQPYHQTFKPNPHPRLLFPTKNPKIHPRRMRKTSIRCIFTGIVEEIGELRELGLSDDGGSLLKIKAKTVTEDVKQGDSIAVDGICLTVTSFDKDVSEFTVGVSPETKRRTSVMELAAGSAVNLERALSLQTRMGGHFVQGHVDGTGQIVSMEKEGDSLWVKVRADDPLLLRYVVPKGFVAVDGASLTVVDVFDEEKSFSFMLVAYTQKNVGIPLKKVGGRVNLEVDVLGKYVERVLSFAH